MIQSKLNSLYHSSVSHCLLLNSIFNLHVNSSTNASFLSLKSIVFFFSKTNDLHSVALTFSFLTLTKANHGMN